MVDNVTPGLIRYFVPKHLAFGHITRADVAKKHPRPIAQQLLADDNLSEGIIILDGTYVHIQKSHSNVLR